MVTVDGSSQSWNSHQNCNCTFRIRPPERISCGFWARPQSACVGNEKPGVLAGRKMLALVPGSVYCWNQLCYGQAWTAVEQPTAYHSTVSEHAVCERCLLWRCLPETLCCRKPLRNRRKWDLPRCRCRRKSKSNLVYVVVYYVYIYIYYYSFVYSLFGFDCTLDHHFLWRQSELHSDG